MFGVRILVLRVFQRIFSVGIARALLCPIENVLGDNRVACRRNVLDIDRVVASDLRLELDALLDRFMVCRSNGVLRRDDRHRIHDASIAAVAVTVTAIIAAAGVSVVIVMIVVIMMIVVMNTMPIVIAAIVIVIVPLTVAIPIVVAPRRRLRRAPSENVHRLITPNLIAVDERRVNV